MNPLHLNGYTYKFRPGTDGRTFLLLHGVGGDETAMDHIGELLAPHSSWLSPKGPVTVDGYSRYFTRQPDASFDPAEVTEQAAAMMLLFAPRYRRINSKAPNWRRLAILTAPISSLAC